MTFKFILELWNPIMNRYHVFGEYNNLERANIMFNKPYNRIATRRIIKITEEIIIKATAEKP